MNNLEAGFARVITTPMLGIGLAGYFQKRIADGVLDDLEINALALKSGDDTVILLSTDILYFHRETIADYKAFLSEATGLPKDAFYIHGTHSHTAPYLIKDSENPLEQEYYQFLRRKMADAALLSIADLKPAKMGIGTGTAPGIAFVRRYRMKDGSVRTNPGVNNPEILAPIGDVDERVSLLRFDREGADTIALVQFACHPDTVGGTKVSADWPGFVRRTVEQTLDHTKCIFFNGAQGDINHVKVHTTDGDLNDMFLDFDDVSRGYGHSRYMGRVVTGGVLQAFDKVKYLSVDAIRYQVRTIQVASQMPDASEVPEAQRITELFESGREAELPYKGMMLTTKLANARRILRLQHGPAQFEMELSAVSIGKVALIGIPGEPFTGIGRALKQSPGWEMVLPTCCTNGAQGYFPMKEAYDEGGYESGNSNYRAGVAEQMIEEGNALLSELSEN